MRTNRGACGDAVVFIDAPRCMHTNPFEILIFSYNVRDFKWQQRNNNIWFLLLLLLLCVLYLLNGVYDWLGVCVSENAEDTSRASMRNEWATLRAHRFSTRTILWPLHLLHASKSSNKNQYFLVHWAKKANTCTAHNVTYGRPSSYRMLLDRFLWLFFASPSNWRIHFVRCEDGTIHEQ